MYTINYWSILVASAVSFGLGALWYSPILFGKDWMALSKISSADISAKAGSMLKLYVAQAIAVIISFLVLGFIISSTGVAGGTNGAFMAFLIWLGFSATESVGSLIWEKKPLKLILIQSVGTLVSLVVGGAIIGAWR